MQQWVGIAATCVVVFAGCSAPSESAKVGSGEALRDVSAQTSLADSPRPSESALPPEDIQKLFSRMDALGAGSQKAYEQELAHFIQAGDALDRLKDTYAHLPTDAVASRWRAVYIAGQIASPASMNFLLGVALAGPEIASGSTEHAAEGAHTDRTYGARSTAAVALVHNFAAGVPGASAAVETLLDNADTEIARNTGVELFSLGKLTDGLRAKLRARNIFSDFRRIEGAELDALRTLDPEHTGRAGAASTKNAQSVPPLAEEVEGSGK